VPPSGRRREKEIRRLTATSDWSNLPAHIKAQLEAQQSRKQSLWILSHMTPDINDHCTNHVHRALTASGGWAWPTYSVLCESIRLDESSRCVAISGLVG